MLHICSGYPSYSIRCEKNTNNKQQLYSWAPSQLHLLEFQVHYTVELPASQTPTPRDGLKNVVPEQGRRANLSLLLVHAEVPDAADGDPSWFVVVMADHRET